MNFRPLSLVWALAFAGYDSRADEVDDFIRPEMAKHRIPGVALAVVRAGKPQKIAAYGLANVELDVPVSPDTVFEIGSITKQFTAAAILLLQQQGKLSVDDSINRYLPFTPPQWEEITIRHLLSHTSGIKNYTGLDGFEVRRHLSPEQFIREIAAYPLDFAPGHSWKYCNTGYNLLGFIIEKASGKNYWEFLSERIFRPLGMNATTNRLPALVITNRAAGYEQTNHIWINRDNDLTDVFSAGAIISTVGDLVKWDVALDGDQLLTRQSKELMWTPGTQGGGKQLHYGLGWSIESFKGHSNIGHGGSTSGFSASLQRFPDQKLTVIVLTNTGEEIATPLAMRIAGFYLPEPANTH
jgi:CubicO group peptidase (beta-lactamase class C family)